jgi:hypothetical protein
MEYEKPTLISLRDHATLNERWVQDQLAADPSLLGLGDLILKDKERIHPQAGRLDLLFQDADSRRRYEVEVQLGKTNESHIIRTIEYWDIERKRYPQYEHTAVIVAESITSRFLNVISLFNGFIPLIAIQMQAFTMGAKVGLVFTTVLSEVRLGLLDEDEEGEATDRSYWENRSSKASLETTDAVLAILRELDPALALKYNKHYIGIAKHGQPNNFVVFRPKKDWVRMEPRLERSELVQAQLDQAGLDVMDYDNSWGRYRIRLVKGEPQKHHDTLLEILRMAFEPAE